MAKNSTMTPRKQYIEIALIYKQHKYTKFRHFYEDIKAKKFSILNQKHYSWLHEISFNSLQQRFHKQIKQYITKNIVELKHMFNMPEMRYGDNELREISIIQKMCESGMGNAEILDYMNSEAHRKKEFIRKVSEIVQLMSQGENTMTSDRWIKSFLVRQYNYTTACPRKILN